MNGMKQVILGSVTSLCWLISVCISSINVFTSQINRDVNESIARLATDDDWKQLVSHQPKDDIRNPGSLHVFYHNLGHVTERKIVTLYAQLG